MTASFCIFTYWKKGKMYLRITEEIERNIALRGMEKNSLKEYN